MTTHADALWLVRMVEDKAQARVTLPAFGDLETFGWLGRCRNARQLKQPRRERVIKRTIAGSADIYRMASPLHG